MPILIVDDEPFFRFAVSSILRRAGFHTIEARDGLEGCEIVRAIGPDIESLLTDFQMPRMDELALIACVRELHPTMPVLLISGSRVEDQPKSCVVLNKPIGGEALLEAVRSAIAAGTARPTRKIEVFTSGNCCHEKLITAIKTAACPSCEVRVLDVTHADVAERASHLGAQFVPAVAINGELVCCPCECGPDLGKLRAAGLGVPLS